MTVVIDDVSGSAQTTCNLESAAVSAIYEVYGVYAHKFLRSFTQTQFERIIREGKRPRADALRAAYVRFKVLR